VFIDEKYLYYSVSMIGTDFTATDESLKLKWQKRDVMNGVISNASNVPFSVTPYVT